MDSEIENADIWVTVSKGYLAGRNRYLVKIERGYLFLEEPGKRIVDIKPRKIFRTSDVSLQLDTGWWNYGRVTLSFNSPSDADKVEQEAKKLRSQRDTFRYKVRQIPHSALRLHRPPSSPPVRIGKLSASKPGSRPALTL